MTYITPHECPECGEKWAIYFREGGYICGNVTLRCNNGFHIKDEKCMPMPDRQRPEYVKCVSLDKMKTWCGLFRHPLEWTFTDTSHAAINGLDRGRLLCCPECAKAIYDALMQNEATDSSA